MKNKPAEKSIGFDLEEISLEEAKLLTNLHQATKYADLKESFYKQFKNAEPSRAYVFGRGQKLDIKSTHSLCSVLSLYAKKEGIPFTVTYSKRGKCFLIQPANFRRSKNKWAPPVPQIMTPPPVPQIMTQASRYEESSKEWLRILAIASRTFNVPLEQLKDRTNKYKSAITYFVLRNKLVRNKTICKFFNISSGSVSGILSQKQANPEFGIRVAQLEAAYKKEMGA